MTKQTLKNFAVALSLLGLALIPSTVSAQAGLASKLPGKNPQPPQRKQQAIKQRRRVRHPIPTPCSAFPELFIQPRMKSIWVRPLQKLRSLGEPVMAAFSPESQERKLSPRPTKR